MKFLTTALLVSVFLSFSPSLAHAASKAKTTLVDSQGKKIGHADFKEIKDGVQITVKVSGLKPGVHAMHIHETGVCTPPDFKSAGAHFNPHGKKHGAENPQGPHAGDLPNIVAAGNGQGRVNFIAPGLKLKGSDGLLKSGKTALVIHAHPDDGKTDPAGNAGDRIACGVIK